MVDDARDWTSLSFAIISLVWVAEAALLTLKITPKNKKTNDRVLFNAYFCFSQVDSMCISVATTSWNIFQLEGDGLSLEY